MLRGLLNERRHEHFPNPELRRKNNSKKKSKINEEIGEGTQEIKCTHDTVSVNYHTSVGINKTAPTAPVKGPRSPSDYRKPKPKHTESRGRPGQRGFRLQMGGRGREVPGGESRPMRPPWLHHGRTGDRRQPQGDRCVRGESCSSADRVIPRVHARPEDTTRTGTASLRQLHPPPAGSRRDGEEKQRQGPRASAPHGARPVNAHTHAAPERGACPGPPSAAECKPTKHVLGPQWD